MSKKNKKNSSKNYRNFDPNYLNEVVTRPGSGVTKEEFDYHLALHPSQLNNFALSVKNELKKRIACYDLTFKGILLGFEHLKLLSECGRIGPDNCFIHLDVRASFFVFRPEIGMTLKGIVSQKTNQHLSCLMYNSIHVSIPKPEDDPDKTWLGYDAAPSNTVECQITFIDLHVGIPYIRGELLSIVLSSEETPNKKKIKKPKKGEDLEVSLDSLDMNALFSNGDVNFDKVAESETPGKIKRNKSKSFSLEEVKLNTDIDLKLE